jgi:peptidoglycan/xylan/chitin deacetylase (PgdA/CDA1 family)
MISAMSKRHLLASALEYSGCNRLLHYGRSWTGLLVLNYHRIGECRHSLLDHQLWSATTEEFDRQVRQVVKEFDVIGLSDLDVALNSRRGRHVLITFDDGYLDNYTEAFPVLKNYGAKATFFITTGFLDVPQIPWWDEIAWMVRTSPVSVIPPSTWSSTPIPLSGGIESQNRVIRQLLNTYKRLNGEHTAEYLDFLARVLQTGRAPEWIAHELWMTWHMLREMQQAGMDFGGHTVNHPVLANLSRSQQDFEVGECRRRLSQELKGPIDAFSYPVGGYGSFNEDTRLALKNHGYRYAFSYLGGCIKTGHYDSYNLRRAAIETDITGPLFQGVLTLPQLFG